MGPAEKSLLEAVQIAALATENGCRVVNDGNQRVCVYDCCKWGKENTTLLLYMKPNADICIQSSINSLSGFRIIVSEPSQSNFSMRMLFALATCVLFVFFYARIQGYLTQFWWGHDDQL